MRGVFKGEGRMVNKLTIVVASGFLFLLCGFTLAQTYTNRLIELGVTVKQDMCMTDAGTGAVLSCGTCVSLDPEYGSCVWAAKTNELGDMLWKKTFMTKDTVTMLAAKVISQNRFMLVARRQESGHSKPFIIILNSSGDTIGTKQCEMSPAVYYWTCRHRIRKHDICPCNIGFSFR